MLSLFLGHVFWYPKYINNLIRISEWPDQPGEWLPHLTWSEWYDVFTWNYFALLFAFYAVLSNFMYISGTNNNEKPKRLHETFIVIVEWLVRNHIRWVDASPLQIEISLSLENLTTADIKLIITSSNMGRICRRKPHCHKEEDDHYR